jgi:membrane-bound lytic murein transglycosylase D
MGKGSSWAVLAVGLSLPILVLLLLVAHPRSRGIIASFFAPLPAAQRDGGARVLPALGDVRGAESTELKTLREDASAQATGAQPVRKRSALFGLGTDGEIPGGDRFVRPAGLRRPDIMLRDDASADRALQHLTADAAARDRFVDAWKRSDRFSTDITRILHAWKIPEALLAVALVESAFQPSMAGEESMGAWQLTPDVAHVYGLSMLPAYDERRGVSSSTEAAARYLADLRERFGTWELALAAYAGGYKRTLDVVTKQSTVDFWELAPSLPRAAVVYVAEVMGTATLIANLERFGLDTVKRAEPATLSDLDVAPGTSLALVARAASVSPATFRELNPEYTGDVVPTTSFRMVVHVPSAMLARARELLPLMREGKDVPGDDAGPEPAATPGEARPVISRGSEKRAFYRVHEGDTLPALARQYGLPVETIASDNALDATSSLQPGMILAIRMAEPVDVDASPRIPR